MNISSMVITLYLLYPAFFLLYNIYHLLYCGFPPPEWKPCENRDFVFCVHAVIPRS